MFQSRFKGHSGAWGYLLATNFGNPNPVKFGRCLVELERIYGITNGGNRGNQYNKKEAHWNNSNLPTQKDLADQIGIDQSQLINYKKLTTLIPELQDLIETDQIKANQFGSVVSPTLDEPIRTDESVAKDLDMGRLLGRI